MELFHKRLEETLSKIKEHKEKHEKLILQSVNSINIVESQKDSNGNVRLAKAENATKFMDLLTSANPNIGTKPNNSVAGTNAAAQLARIMNMDCVIMPHSNEISAFQKLWPQSLIFHRGRNSVEIGNIESHGSLWKILPCVDDSTVEPRVMLQTSVRAKQDKNASNVNKVLFREECISIFMTIN